MVWAILTSKGLSTNLDEMNIGWKVFIIIAIYIETCFVKIHCGSAYPSDCIVAALPIMIIIGLSYALQALERLAKC